MNGKSACHAGGRGFESRRSRLFACFLQSFPLPSSLHTTLLARIGQRRERPGAEGAR
jgi:hypothetical protein